MTRDLAAPEFFRLVDIGIDAADLARHPELIDRIHRREIQAARIRGFFPEPLLADLVARLERGELGIDGADAREGAPVQLYGPTLQWSPPDLRAYFAAAARFRARCAALFDYEARIHETLAHLAGGRRVAAPRGPSGEAYGCSTFRRISQGGRIPPHFENHQLDFPGYAHLREQLQTDAILSFYLTLAPSDAGGHLAVHAMTLEDFARGQGEGGGRDFLERALESFPRREIETVAGDLLVFDGGRFAHAVTPVTGARPRWTVGGVLALSRTGETLYSWH